MNLKNLDWMHVAYLVVAIVVGVYNILVANGVSFPAQVATVMLMLTAIGGLLKQSPVATPIQLSTKTTKADIRASMRPPSAS